MDKTDKADGMDLKELREHIDRLDNALLFIMAERMSFIPKVANYKKKNKIPRYQPEREKQIIEKKRKLAEDNGINPDFIEKIYREIIEEAHRTEKSIMGE